MSASRAVTVVVVVASQDAVELKQAQPLYVQTGAFTNERLGHSLSVRNDFFSPATLQIQIYDRIAVKMSYVIV